MTRRPKVICAGRLCVDLLFSGMTQFPKLGSEVFSDGLAVEPGGGAVITAAYLSALEIPTDLLAMVPPEPFGSALKAKIDAPGVGLSCTRDMRADADPQITVAMIHGSDRAFLTRRSGSALPPNTADLVRGSGADHLHIGELATLAECPDLVTAARGAGMTISLDCSWDSALFGQEISGLIASVDIFLPNAAEVEALSSAGIAMPLAPLTVIKRGDQGANAILNGEFSTSPALDVDAIDSTGAGDAFNAGFLATWITSSDIRASLESGNRLGAAAVAQVGGTTGAKSLLTG